MQELARADFFEHFYIFDAISILCLQDPINRLEWFRA